MLRSKYVHAGRKKQRERKEDKKKNLRSRKMKIEK